MRIAGRSLVFASLVAVSLRCWAEPPPLVLATQRPSESEFIHAMQTMPATNWLEATITYPNGLTGVPLLYHAVASGMTNAVDLLVQSSSRFTPRPGSMFDPIGAAIVLKQWDLLDRLLSSDVGQHLDGCSCCDYLGLLMASTEHAFPSQHLARLAEQCGTCDQHERADLLLLSALASTNTSLSKWLMQAGANPQYSLWHKRVVVVGNATLENLLVNELMSAACIRLATSNVIMNIGGVESRVENDAVYQHDWQKTLESAATQSGFRAALIEVMDAGGGHIFTTAVHPAALKSGVNLFLRDHSSQ